MRKTALLFLTLLTMHAHASAIDAKALETLVDAIMTAEMKKQEIPGAAFILVQNGRVVLAKGYGLADIERKKPVDPAKTIFPIGSITKVFTAMAVVQLAERGQLDLNADVNRYLKTIQVPAKYDAPVTARHLLTHSAGFDELVGVRMLRSPDERVQPLAVFLASRLIRIRPPGEMTAYSSFGTALAGLLVEDISETSYERYLACNVWAPLKMNRTHVTTPEDQRDDLAVAYESDQGKLVAIPYERYHSAPASSINSSAADMGRYMLAILGEGSLEGARILSEKSMREMTTQQMTMHPRMPGFGYGFQLWDDNGQRIVEHGGNIGGFHSLMTLLPEHETGFYVVAHREGANLRDSVRTAILNRWFPQTNPAPAPKADPSAAPRLQRLAGTYRANIWCHTCPFDPDRVQDARVTVNADGTLSGWGTKWIEVAPLFFRTPDGKRRIGFHEDAKGNITAMTSGAWMVMERLP
ncbi:MAG TPA: serine hydrolase domain-containing protein [Thermoanaerobaculia bacterium]|nr:serine hydrolase domain-containing protein [Thermoanaerobaculia bacterium]